MDAQAGMLAKLFERSMGPGPEWEVSDVWFEQKEKGPDELHIRVAHVKGQAVECPECGRRCGIYDARERTWRHLDIWQYETIVHCAVPRADCPEHGVHTVQMPWEVRPNSHFTALFEAQVLAMAISGLTATQIASQMRMSDGTVWRMLGRAVAEARDAADYSDVTRVGIDDTACRRGQSYITTMVDLDGRKAVAVTEGRDKGAIGRLCGDLEAHGGVCLVTDNRYGVCPSLLRDQRTILTVVGTARWLVFSLTPQGCLLLESPRAVPVTRGPAMT